MPVLGSAVRVALYDEVTYAVSSGLTLGMLAYYVECGLAASRNAVQSNVISMDRSRSLPGLGNLDLSGPFKVELAPQDVGFYLRHILGAPVTVGASAPYTHTFRPSTLPVGLLVEKNWVTAGITSKVEHFLGGKVAEATFDFPQEGAATLSMTIQGSKYTIAAAPLDATLADPGHTGWFAPDVSINIGGSACLIAKSASIKISNNLQTDRYALGTGGLRVDMPEGFADVSGSVNVIVDTTLFSAFIDKAQARTDTALEVICTFGTGTGASAGNEKLSLKLDHAIIDLTSVPINSPAGVEVSFNFTGYKSGGTDKGLVAVLLSPLANTLIAAT